MNGIIICQNQVGPDARCEMTMIENGAGYTGYWDNKIPGKTSLSMPRHVNKHSIDLTFEVIYSQTCRHLMIYRKETLYALSKKASELSSQSALGRFDRFVDEIFSPIGRPFSPEDQFEPRRTMAEYSDRIRAAYSKKDETFHTQTPYTDTPQIKTGAGAHFNASYATGHISGPGPSVCMTSGVAFASYDGKIGASPTLFEIITFISNWK